MRAAAVLGVLVVLVGSAAAQKEPAPKRYGVEPDLDGYPQTTPKDALRSVIRAADAGRFDYLVAQLADPAWVDGRVQALGSFERLLQTVRDNFANNPEELKQLRRFLAEGEVEESGEAAAFKHKDIKSRQVFLRKIGGRWYVEDRQKPK
jgi:hypothetical protein